MQRKNRKWVALAVGLYLFLMYSAARWAINQREPEGNIFNRLEREGIARLAAERAEAAVPQPRPTGETRLKAAAPAYVAARYDRTHVVFMVVTDTESRFSDSRRWRLSTVPTKLPIPSTPAAPLAALHELYEPDSQSLHFFPEIIQKTPPGEEWNLSLSPEQAISAVIERPVIAPLGCSLALGFLAAIPADQQAVFAATDSDYFSIRRAAVESADPPVDAHIAELHHWKLSGAAAKQIEQQLIARMKQDVTQIDARFLTNAAGPGEAAGELPNGGARPHLKEWIHADQGLIRGEGKLAFDTRSFRLTPDQAPRIFVRARWTLAGATVFLMTAWFKEEAAPSDPSAARYTLLFADSSWSTALRETDHTGTLGEDLDFQSVLNELDADRDGWAEVLIHSTDLRDQGASSAITLYSYSDKGLILLKTPFRRTAESPESCLAR